MLKNFKTKYHFLTLAFVILIFSFYLLRFSKLFEANYTLMQTQIILFPISLLILNLYLKKKLFRLLSVVAFILYLVGISAAFSLLPLQEQSILLGRFQDDEFESQTRILRKKINDYLSDKEGLKITRYYASFKDTKESQLFLKANPEVFGLLWAGNKGSKKQQLFFSQSSVEPKKINFSKAQILRTHGASNESMSRIRELLNELKWFEKLPEITLPLEPVPAVSAFLAELLYGLRFNSELHLLSAGTIQATWPFSDHLAYARFRLSNLYFLQFQNNSEYEQGLLNCVMAAHNNAMRILDPSKKHSALGVALRYNALLVALIDASESNNLQKLNSIKSDFEELAKSIALRLKPKRKNANKKLPIMLEFISSVARESRRSAVHVKKIRALLSTGKVKIRNKQGKRLNKQIKQEAKIGGD